MIYRHLELGLLEQSWGWAGRDMGRRVEAANWGEGEGKQFPARVIRSFQILFCGGYSGGALHLQGAFQGAQGLGPLYSLNNLTLGPLKLPLRRCQQRCDPTHPPPPPRAHRRLPSFLALGL